MELSLTDVRWNEAWLRLMVHEGCSARVTFSSFKADVPIYTKEFLESHKKQALSWFSRHKPPLPVFHFLLSQLPSGQLFFLLCLVSSSLSWQIHVNRHFASPLNVRPVSIACWLLNSSVEWLHWINGCYKNFICYLSTSNWESVLGDNCFHAQ